MIITRRHAELVSASFYFSIHMKDAEIILMHIRTA